MLISNFVFTIIYTSSLISIPYERTYVQTPNGSPVEAIIFNDEYTQEEKQFLVSYMNNEYPNAYLLSEPTKKYNCHSYAWYQRSTSNIFWIDDPNPFIDDASYSEITIPLIDAIICYFDSNNSLTHSGVISNCSPNSNIDSNLIVTSKWSSYGLYSHVFNDCPYYEDGTTLKFYHMHSFDTFEMNNLYTHKAICLCGYEEEKSHVWIPFNSYFKCKKCNYISRIIPGTIFSFDLEDENFNDQNIYIYTFNSLEYSVKGNSKNEADYTFNNFIS